MIVQTRAEAIQLGLKRFFTGEPCRKAGHIAERYTSNNACLECHHPKMVAKAPEGSNVLHGIAFPIGTPEDTMVMVMRHIQNDIHNIVARVDAGLDPRSKDSKAIKMIGCGLSYNPKTHRFFKAGMVHGYDVWLPAYRAEFEKDSILNPQAAGPDMGVFMQTVYDKERMAREVWVAAKFDMATMTFTSAPVYLWKHDFTMANLGLIGPHKGHAS